MDPRIWLASASPRRRSLLEQVGLKPIVRTSDVVEVLRAGEGARGYTERLALEKGEAVRDALDVSEGDDLPWWLVAADTVVVHAGDILEKPTSDADARRLLGCLSGAEHEVVTGFWIGDREGDRAVVASVVTSVCFRTLSRDEIARYVASGEPMDKAGGYGIQGVGASFVEGISGCYFNVVGLPLSAVLEAMREVGALGAFPFVD